MYHFQVQKMTHMQLIMNDIVYIENCRRPCVAILDMQMSKIPIISGYAVLCILAGTKKLRFSLPNLHTFMTDI
jgi:hypothetical protein